MKRICIFYIILKIAVLDINLGALNIFSQLGAFKDDFYSIKIFVAYSFG